MSTMNFVRPKFTKHLIVNSGNSVALGIANVVLAVTGLPVKGSTTGESFELQFALRSLGLRLTSNGTFQVKFPQHLRTKAAPLVDGQVVIDPATSRPLRVPDLKDGKEQWDEDYAPITVKTRSAFTEMVKRIDGVAEAIIEARNALAEKLGVDAGASSDAPAPADGPSDFSA